VNVRDILKRLTADGWIEVAKSGSSHRQFKHPHKPGRVTIAFHGTNQDVPIGTWKSIARQAGWESDR
jgi:predicted RNA binding protein YcfA (HicA-like mRNA interferase family)